MKTQLRRISDSLKSSYWFVPVVMMALALVLFAVTSKLDYTLSATEKKNIAWLYVSDADTMRTLLLTIAATIIGIVGVVFSVIMVPISIAASQFGPRLLRTFLRDTGTQVTLGTFTATFIFCMAVLLRLSDKPSQQLPQISVNVALLLGLACFGILIYFINHVAVSVQAPVLVSRVSKELNAAIDNELSDHVDDDGEGVADLSPDLSLPADIILSVDSGYVLMRDDDRLLKLAQKKDCVIELLRQPGDFVAKSTPIAKVWATLPLSNSADSINAAFILGPRRTLVQDITFGVNELVEVAVRALSPAINDPFTAMTCLDWLGAALCKMCGRIFPEKRIFDDKDQLRLIRSPVTFTSLVNAAFDLIREYGRTSQAVTLRMMQTIKVVALCAKTKEQCQVLLYHAMLVEKNCKTGLTDEVEKQEIVNCHNEVRSILGEAERPVSHSQTNKGVQ